MKNRPYAWYEDIPRAATLSEFLEKIHKYGDAPAVSWLSAKQKQYRSYNELYSDVRKVQRMLADHGVGKGSLVSLFSENSYEWIVFHFAITTMGAVVIPIDFSYNDEGVSEVLKRTDCNVLCVSANVTLSSELFTGTDIIPMKIPSESEESTETAVISPDDVAEIVFTSGTTGKPNGVMLTHKNLCTDIFCSASSENYLGDQICTLPFTHAFGLMSIFVPFTWGQTAICCPSPRRLSALLTEYSPKSFIAVPAIMNIMYNGVWKKAKETGAEKKLRKALKLSDFLMNIGIDVRRKMFKDIRSAFGGNVEKVMCGGAAFDPEMVHFFKSIGINILMGYGITECSPTVSVNRIHHFKFASSGIPLLGVSIKTDETNGEILVKGDIVMKGYFRDEEATKAAFTADGWFKTGDTGYIDSDGFLYVTGRIKNLIILSNGKNVSAEELENNLMRIEGIEEVLCYGMDDVITAEIYASDGADREEISRQIKALNASALTYKRIGKIVFRDTPFEKTASNKIKRK